MKPDTHEIDDACIRDVGSGTLHALRARAMARKLRFVPRDGMVVVVMRCSEGRALLAPHDELNRRILGILGRALHLFPILLHVFQFLPNHLHMMMTVADAKRLSDFMG